LVELISPYEYYFAALVGYGLFIVRLFPFLGAFVLIFISFVIWPLLKPFLLKKIIIRIPWAFVEEVPLKTRLRYGVHLVRKAIKRG